ncbi:MAG: cysteine--tRNA ligase [Spirochaetes bacterium]|nr:cysteine--tRNA ligase [Spirochaetota bacterium]
MIKIFNTLTKKIEEFIPNKEKEVKMYACGITVYDEAHIGHGYQAIIFDIIRSYLQYRGYKVTYVRNFTDIDDKIIKKSKESGKPFFEITEYYIKDSLNDLFNLKVREADFQPKVTDHINDIIEFIKVLIEKKFAYVVDGEVLFDTRKFTEYGKLSKIKIDENISLETGETEEEKKRKKHFTDFSLWKPSKEGEPAWDSPWGKGRPGWHIECSVMAMKYLGDQLDIHGGGIDLVFPHHENEIAQSEAYSGKPFAKYWVHNGLVMINNQKMSKSLNNFYTIKDILKLYQADVIRYIVFSNHYSSPINFSLEIFKNASKRVYYFYSTLEKIYDIAVKYSFNNIFIFNEQNIITEINYYKKIESILNDNKNDFYIFFNNKNTFVTIDNIINELETKFIEYMDDNFNTAKTMGLFSEIFKKINEYIELKNINDKEKLLPLLKFYAHFIKIANVLNIFNEIPSNFIKKFKDLYLKEINITEDFINSKINERLNYKKMKDFVNADKIRDELLKNYNIKLLDGKEGTKWMINF